MGTLIPVESHNAGAAQRAAFDDRYGHGSFDELLRQLAQPCRSFAEIANHFGVTRERVRQWQLQWLPHAPTGRERRHLCAAYRAKRRLMLDPLFRTFHQHARTWVDVERIRPLRSRRGYRTRTVRIDGYVVALRDAVSSAPRYRGRADFIYFRLPGDEFLFVAASGDTSTHPRNTFAAFDAAAGGTRESFSPKEQSL